METRKCETIRKKVLNKWKKLLNIKILDESYIIQEKNMHE